MFIRNLNVWAKFNKVHIQYLTNIRKNSTIFALASGHGKCAVSIFRVSGHNASSSLLKMCKLKQLPEPRVALLKRIYDPESNQLIDKGLILWFPKPASFTGEDCCEFHVHGGIAVRSAIFNAFNKLENFRPAEAGEFSKRAFYNGKLDLTQIEGLADVIDAETEAQRKQAILQMDGVTGLRYKNWSKELLECLAHIEAFIDFSEDENIEDGVVQKVVSRVETLQKEINLHLNDGRRGERLRNGVNVAIVGEPNVGKSSLFNVLSQRPAAIVSSVAGTTRDVIQTSFDIDGFPVVFSDTAGLRSSTDVVELEGVRRAKVAAQQADLVVFVLDASKFCENGNLKSIDVNEYLSEFQQNLKIDSNVATLVVLNKIDLINGVDFNLKSDFIPISCYTGDNVEKFIKLLSNEVKKLCINSNDNTPLTNARHRQHLIDCSSCLELFSSTYEKDVVLAAEYLRKSLHHLGKITGKTTTEEILNVIFNQFCIGK